MQYVPHLIAAYLLQAGGEKGGEIPDTVKVSHEKCYNVNMTSF